MITSLSDRKLQLRAAMRSQRQQLSDADRLGAGQRIGVTVARFVSKQKPPAILAYADGPDQEAPTLPWLSSLLKMGCPILLPVTGPDHVLHWGTYNRHDRLVVGRHGILEPPPADHVIGPPPDGALVLVPGIAFDAQGNRLGFGAGYYDRFLAVHKGLRAGLAYGFQVVDTVPAEPHDIAMDFVITDEGTIRCGRKVPKDAAR